MTKKLLVRGRQAVAVLDAQADVVLADNEALLSYPEEVPLEAMDEGFVETLRLDGVEAARQYYNRPKYPSTISLWRLRKRFTFEQRVAIESARKTSPIIETLMRDLESVRGNIVDLALSDTQQGVMALVAEGLISESRAAYILFYGDGEPPEPVDL